jgi:GT2 family glycosyltransferase
MSTRPPLPQEVMASVIIPVFNKSDLTHQCLESIVRAGGDAPFEAIVVDDASTDDTQEVLSKWKHCIRVLRNPTNMGFARSCNRGASEAAGKHLLFLNNDTIVLRGWLDAMVDEVESHADVTAVGSKLLYQDGLVQHAGVAFGRESRSPYHPHRLLPSDDPRVNKRRELQAVTAACVLVRRPWFQKFGGFSEVYQTGYEDLDMCIAIRRSGGRIVYQPKSTVIHLESQTPGRMRHEGTNRPLWFSRWSDQLLSDEDDYYFLDDLRVVRRREETGEVVRCVRIQSGEERARWAIVAECQREAASGRMGDALGCLAKTDAWPIEAAVRRWAGSVCHRMGERESARAHFAAALALEPTPELRVHVALHEPELSSSGTPAPWEAPSIQGLTDLRAGHFDRARTALEKALALGAPPVLVLPGLWDAAQRLGHDDEATSLRAALAGMTHVDPATRQRLAEELSRPS